MTSPRAFTATGPSEVLAGIARRFGVRANREALEARFERHESPRSLKALLEIAPELGLTARGFRSDIAGLADAPLPAIVHLIDPGSGEAGFGVLLECVDRIVVEEAPGAAPTKLTAEEFLSVWSGVVVTVASQSGTVPAVAPDRPSIFARWRDWYAADDPLTRATLVARHAALFLLAVLCLTACLRLGRSLHDTWTAAGAALGCALAGLGAVVSTRLFFQSRRSVVPAGPSRLASAFCGRGAFADCLSVLSSRFARFAGIDWGSLGAAWFASVLLLAAAGGFLESEPRRLLFTWLSIAALLAVPESLVLVAIQIWPLRRICPLCMTIHAAVLASAGLAAAFLATSTAPIEAGLLPWAVAHLVAFVAAFGLFVSYLSHSLEVGVHRVRLGWIGATPLGALAEMAGRPKGTAPIPAACIRLGAAGAPIRIDALVHPVCSGCGPVVAKLGALAARHAGMVTIGLHLPPRDAASAADREFCTALSAAGLLSSGAEALATFLRVKEDPWPLVKTAEQGARAVVAKLLPGVDSPEAAIAAAREAVLAADRLADALERGTPTLLVEGRLWDGSVDDLERVLASHPTVLAAVLGKPLRAVDSPEASS